MIHLEEATSSAEALRHRGLPLGAVQTSRDRKYGDSSNTHWVASHTPPKAEHLKLASLKRANTLPLNMTPYGTFAYGAFPEMTSSIDSH